MRGRICGSIRSFYPSKYVGNLLIDNGYDNAKALPRPNQLISTRKKKIEYRTVSDGCVPVFAFLCVFRICFAPLRETKSSEIEFRAKAQSRIERRKGKPGHQRLRRIA